MADNPGLAEKLRYLRVRAVAAIAAMAWCVTPIFVGVATGSARAEIVAGLGVPMAGQKSQVGLDIQSAAEGAVALLNSSGGIDGETVRLVVENDDCTSEGGTRAAESLVRQRAVLVLGHPCSNAAIAAAKTYAAAGVWFVAIGAGHPDLTAKRAGPTIFRLGGRDDRQAADTVAAIATHFNGKRIAIVHDRTTYARTLADGVATGLRSAGQPAIAMEGIVAGKMHYADVARRLKSLQADAIYFAGFPNEYEILVSDIKSAGITAAMMASDAAAADSALQSLQPSDLIEGHHLSMVHRSIFAKQPNEWVLASFEAFKKSARNLNNFVLLLGVDANGDSQSATFVAAAKACVASQCK